MTLLDDVKAICDRLGAKGWRDLLRKVTDNKLDIRQNSAAALKTALLANLPAIDRSLPGFEDFDPNGAQGITPFKPASSLLYHALASPRVQRDASGAMLMAFPTVAEIEAVENLVFAITPRMLSEVAAAAGGDKLSIVSYAVEYRPAPDTAHSLYADLTFSRTGIARVGTARPKYLPEWRGQPRLQAISRGATLCMGFLPRSAINRASAPYTYRSARRCLPEIPHHMRGSSHLNLQKNCNV
jgi:hypothetical protein